MQWATAAILICCASVLTSCSNSDNPSVPNTTVLTEWQAGKTVSLEVVEAYGGIDKCFAAEPIPDGVWARMQGKTFKENPYIGRDDLRHVRALHWDYDNQMHIGEMVMTIQESFGEICSAAYSPAIPLPTIRTSVLTCSSRSASKFRR